MHSDHSTKPFIVVAACLLFAFAKFSGSQAMANHAQFSTSFLTDAGTWPGSAADAGIYGQGFTPDWNATPNPGHVESDLVGLDRFTFFKDGNTDTSANIKLAIFNSFYPNLVGLSTSRMEFVGMSTNTIASTADLAEADPYTFEFASLQLEYGGDYGAIFVNDDGLGNLTPIKVSALTANYAETPPGSGVWVPVSNYGTDVDYQYSTSNFIRSDVGGDYLDSFSYAGDARFEAVFDASLPGDFDGNGVVNGGDLAQWEGDFGLNGESDADNDGDSDGGDFLIWQRNFDGLPSPLAISNSVPEPSSIACAGLISISMLCIRYRRYC